MISKYLELGKEERDARREAYTTFHSVEESAYAKGAAHDNGSASFFRRFTPRGAAHWINSIFNADWSDPLRGAVRLSAAMVIPWRAGKPLVRQGGSLSICFPLYNTKVVSTYILTSPMC